jgi:hypothetical protein
VRDERAGIIRNYIDEALRSRATAIRNFCYHAGVLSYLAKVEDFAAGIIFFITVVLLFVCIGVAQLKQRYSPKLLGARFKRFFGADFKHLQAHDKNYPGYDLASIHRALLSYFEDHCRPAETVGSAMPTSSARDLLQSDDRPYGAWRRKPAPMAYERVAVALDEEESFPANCLYFAQTKGDPGEKLAVLLSYAKAYRAESGEDMDERSAPASVLTLSVACRRRELADVFFREIESRRKRLSVYRGKVIDPVVTGGGIVTIAFRNIARVSEGDLVLPKSVRDLIHGSIVSFYSHQDALRALGVEMKRGILFNSPPGTGKTSVSLYLAGLLPNFTICFVSGRRLLFPREVCAMARYLQPTMLVFEDIDLIAQERETNGLATVLGELMNQIDGCEPNDQVLFIMNTNSMERLEAAVRNRPGRVDQIIHIPLPDNADRKRLIQHFARSVSVSSAAVDALVGATHGVTPAILKEVIKRAAVMAVERTSANGDGQAGGAIELSEADLLLSVEQVLALRSDLHRLDPLAREPIRFGS